MKVCWWLVLSYYNDHGQPEHWHVYHFCSFNFFFCCNFFVVTVDYVATFHELDRTTHWVGCYFRGVGVCSSIYVVIVVYNINFSNCIFSNVFSRIIAQKIFNWNGTAKKKMTREREEEEEDEVQAGQWNSMVNGMFSVLILRNSVKMLKIECWRYVKTVRWHFEDGTYTHNRIDFGENIVLLTQKCYEIYQVKSLDGLAPDVCYDKLSQRNEMNERSKNEIRTWFHISVVSHSTIDNRQHPLWSAL